MAIVLPSTWGRDPPGRLSWGITRGLTNRWPLDDASSAGANSGVVLDIVGNISGINPASNAAFSIDGPSASRGLRFGQGGNPNPVTASGSGITSTWSGSCSFWLWLDQYDSSDGAGTDPRPVAFSAGSTNGNILITTQNGTGTFIAFQTDSTTNSSWTPTGGALPLSQWMHIVCVNNLSVPHHFVYLNGILLTTNLGSQGEAPGNGDSFGGRLTTGVPSRSPVGRMADLRLYTGTFLTGDEVSQLYNSAFIADPGYGYTLPDEGEMPALFTPAAPPPVAQATALGFIEVEW